MERDEMVLRLPKWLNEQLKASAKKAGVTRHAYILRLLTDWSEKSE